MAALLCPPRTAKLRTRARARHKPDSKERALEAHYKQPTGNFLLRYGSCPFRIIYKYSEKEC